MKCINCRWVAVLRVCSRQFDRPARWCFFFFGVFTHGGFQGSFCNSRSLWQEGQIAMNLGSLWRGDVDLLIRRLEVSSCAILMPKGLLSRWLKARSQKWCLIALLHLIVVPLRTVRLLFAAAGKDYEARSVFDRWNWSLHKVQVQKWSEALEWRCGTSHSRNFCV